MASCKKCGDKIAVGKLCGDCGGNHDAFYGHETIMAQKWYVAQQDAKLTVGL